MAWWLGRRSGILPARPKFHAKTLGKDPMKKRKLGKSAIEIAPLMFGVNVFGWTADEAVGQTGALIFTKEDIAKGAVETEIAAAALFRADARSFNFSTC